MTRKTVPLTSQEAELIERAREAGTPQHEAFVKLLGKAPTRSEAATLRALVGLALHQLGEEVALSDYERLAASRDAEDEAFDKAMRRRRGDRR
ncbi:MAG TPA: hypothetical protein DGG94_08810 [Micromonosporaceae bacterium]|nr:hypothetical protein [Micromonosporaceae bacterium]